MVFSRERETPVREVVCYAESIAAAAVFLGCRFPRLWVLPSAGTHGDGEVNSNKVDSCQKH